MNDKKYNLKIYNSTNASQNFIYILKRGRKVVANFVAGMQPARAPWLSYLQVIDINLLIKKLKFITRYQKYYRYSLVHLLDLCLV